MMRVLSLVSLAGALAALLSGGVRAQARTLDRQRAAAHAAVIGGTPAASGEFPSLAEVLDVRGREIGQCTGTVIAPTLIMTAGHCAENVRTGVPDKASGFAVL